MSERLGANGMPMKVKEETSDEMISEILEVNPNKKSKKAKKEEEVSLSSEWIADEDVKDEEL
jgi:methionine salvage enolase-phosphatase E1